MRTDLTLAAAAAAAGALLAAQAPTNALLARGAGSPILAALISFAVGALGLALAALVVRGAPPALAATPWYAWLGGLYGAAFVAVAAFAAPRIGVSTLLTAAVAGQLLAGLALDQVGAFGLPRHPLSLLRIVGAALALGGVALVQRG